MATRVSVSATIEHELLTAGDFLEWLEPGRHADLIDGEIAMHSPVSTRHAHLLNFVDRLLGTYIDRHGLGFLFREVVAVKLSGRNVFLPDLAFYTADRADAVQATHVEGAPDLVVEVLSPRTAERDTGPKFAEYEQHGVREYWILDPETLAHRFYRRGDEYGSPGDNGRADELIEFAGGEDRIESRVVRGFFLERRWLDPAALPRIDTALLEIDR